MLGRIYILFKKTIGSRLFLLIIVLALLCDLVQSCVLFLPFIIEKFINQIQNGILSYDCPKLLIILYAMIFVIHSFLVWLYGKVQISSKVKLQLSLFDNLLKINPIEIKNRGEGFYTSLMETSVETILNCLTPYSISSVVKILQNIIIIFILFYKNIYVGVLCTGLFILYFIAFLLNNYLFSNVLMEYIEKNSLSISKIYDFIKGNKVLLSDDLYQQFAHLKVNNILSQVQRIEFKLQYFFELIFSSLSNFIQPCINILIIVLIGRDVVLGNTSFGTFVLVIMFYNIFQSSMDSFQKVADVVFHTNGAIAIISEFVTEPQYKKEELISNNSDYLFKFNNVTYFQKQNCIFNNISFCFNLNENYGLVGFSGIGKTSLLQLFLGFVESSSGIITFLNDDYNCAKINVLKKIAYLDQNSQLFNLSLQENIFLSDKYDKNEFNMIVNLLQLEKLCNRNLGADGNSISGGEKQKVLIARFIHQIKNVDFYILDEPFVGMDIITKKYILNIIKPFLVGKSGICITHDQVVLDFLCNKIVVLNNNELIECNGMNKNIENILLSFTQK